MKFRYSIGESGQHIVFEAQVLDHFYRWKQLHSGMSEAGGQLFGLVDSSRVTIKVATGPRHSDRRGRFFFMADRFAERREITTMYKSGLHYFGDWHTHPQKVPTPSGTDLVSIADLFARSKHELNALLMVIVGTGSFPNSMHVSLHDATAWSKLYPATVDDD
jgi:integrative and conjugative element protein (TIGR02256 family)